MKLFINWLIEPPAHFRWIRKALWSQSYRPDARSLYGAVICGRGECGVNQKSVLYYLIGDDHNAPPGPDPHHGDVVSLTKVGDSPPLYEVSDFVLETDQAKTDSFNRQFSREKIQAERIKKMVDNGYGGRVVGTPRKELRKPFAFIAKQWKRVVSK